MNNIIDYLKYRYKIVTETDKDKIEECLNEINFINNKNISLKDLKENKDSYEENENAQLMQTYVDENSIYLINIFEENNRKKLKNSRSAANLYDKFKNHI